MNSTIQHIGESGLKGTGGNGCTECVGCEYFYGERGLLEQRANREWLSLLCGAALFGLFVTNNNIGNVGIT